VKLGLWIPDKNGNLQPYDFKRGDKVLVNARRGRWVHEMGERMKLMSAEDVLAVLS
jgi:co-chaperonin GroES (HSP10)